MPEEFKPGCQRPPIKKPTLETAPATELNVKEAKQAMANAKPIPSVTAPGS